MSNIYSFSWFNQVKLALFNKLLNFNMNSWSMTIKTGKKEWINNILKNFIGPSFFCQVLVYWKKSLVWFIIEWLCGKEAQQEKFCTMKYFTGGWWINERCLCWWLTMNWKQFESWFSSQLCLELAIKSHLFKKNQGVKTKYKFASEITKSIWKENFFCFDLNNCFRKVWATILM